MQIELNQIGNIESNYMGFEEDYESGAPFDDDGRTAEEISAENRALQKELDDLFATEPAMEA
jgi:hypothetical protein